MRTERRTLLLRAAALSALWLLAPGVARAQAPPPAAGCQPSPTPLTAKAQAPGGEAGGIRILLLDADKKPLARKRFFLLQRSALGTAGIDWAAMPKRADSLRGASPQLREWLARQDCDSLYCPELEAGFAEAVKTVPEFKRAFDAGLRRYGSERLALRWLAVNFPLKDARSEYFRRKRAWLEQAGRKAGKVVSFMTDEKGRAVFTDFKAGDYFISNLFPFEEGGPVWDCKVTTLPPNPRQMWAVTYVLNAPARPAAPAP
jgi:hypothetical protein